MKAAVLHDRHGVPRYEDFPEPVAGDDEVLIEVRAVAVENVDRAVAAGTHYASGQLMPELPAIPCFDGIGVLPDGTPVGFGQPRPPYGALAERTVVPRGNTVPIPAGLDPAVVAAMSSAMTGFAIVTAGGFQAGETVLIQGATGVAGRIAVKIARLLGAGRIVATGRDEAALSDLRTIGADTVINTAVPDAALADAYTTAAGDGYDVVLDFLWGRPTEILLRALVPDEIRWSKPIRLIQTGEAAGPTLTLAAESLRTSGVEIYGAGHGFDPAAVKAAYDQVVSWTRAGTLTFDLTRVPLSDIETAWQQPAPRGHRLVVIP